MIRLRAHALCAALCVAITTQASAQRLGPQVPRPALAAGSDTNDATAYLQFAADQFERDPERAAAAYYWAARIDPSSGDALYGRRAALLMRQPSLLRRVMEGDERTIRSKEVRTLDSLQFRALMLNPFLYRRLERTMLMTYIRNLVMENARRSGETPSRVEVDFAIEQWLRDSKPGMRAWLAYGDGDFDAALRFYSLAVSQAKDKAAVRLDRARIFSMRNEVDSAVTELGLALEEMRKKDEKDLVIFYNSKALAEYSIGVLKEGSGDAAAAREAYGRALQEDLSYYPAHMRLGMLALGAKDTTMAVSELALAAQIAPEEPHIRYLNGYALAATRHFKDAAQELEKATQLEPYYALPYLRLGQVYEQLADAPHAATAYENFLRYASQQNTQRAYATGRLEEVKDFIQPVTKP